MTLPSHTKMASHTPGPWIADNLCMQDDNVVRISAYDGKPDYYHRCMSIAECHVRDDRHDTSSPHVLQAEANARLIAAAPDLLALAKKLAGECAECSGRGYTFSDDGITGLGPDDREPTREACADCADIREVIAKAEGRS